ncbi:MAG: hypothetical protein OXE98_02860 [Hyphomicrobiales bacterium]|nr:hypothetical protein [Hyphomicrobiales bacterium]
MSSFPSEEVAKLRRNIGDGHVISVLSTGIHSSANSMLIYKVVDCRLHYYI